MAGSTCTNHGRCLPGVASTSSHLSFSPHAAMEAIFRLPASMRSRRRVVPSVISAAVSLRTAKTTTRQRPSQRVRPATSPYDPAGQPNSDAYAAPLRGRPNPGGATVDPSTGAINFSIYSANATGINLCLFFEEDLQKGQVSYEIPLDPLINKTGDNWHIMLPQLDETLLYGYRVAGPNQEKQGGAEGNRFDPNCVMIDPYSRAVIGRRAWGEMGPDIDYAAPGTLGVARTWPQCAGTLPSVRETFDWEGDQPLNIPMEDLVIYEMHVRGFTQNDNSGVFAKGTFAGIVERLDYLVDLGINAVELMPIHEFNELEYYQVIPGTTEYRHNFWGYSTVNYFAPMSRYSHAAKQGRDGESIVNEFKQMVKECHRRGIEVLLDVVFNHTAEGNEQGLSLSFRGLDNRVYYMLAPKGEYYNYSGCGNTFNCNHPHVRQFITDCLRYWVEEFHVDGFRFDLASIMTRAHSLWHQQVLGSDGKPVAAHSQGPIVNHDGMMTDGAGTPTGTPLSDPPLVEMISEDPVLRNTKLIAEAWDCDGLNQVGAFPHYGGRWAEWNGHFRDTVRQFIKGTDGNWTSLFASAMCGSPDIYMNNTPLETDWWGSNGGRKWKGNRGPQHSVNFITAHDGFTLADLVAYNEKKNQANGEDNRDGESHNLSWNCGEEGVTTNPKVNMLRDRQMRNFACALMLAQGVPMLLMGDEYGHTKGGNNNTYCHDTDVNWFDWDHMQRNSQGYGRFWRSLIKFRRARQELRRNAYPEGDTIQWHGVTPFEPNWDPSNRFLAFTIRDGTGGGLYVAFNTSHLPVTPSLPPWEGRAWRPVADTSKLAPFDFLVADDVLTAEDVEVEQGTMTHWMQQGLYPMLPWSCVILESAPYQPPRFQLSGVPAEKRFRPAAQPQPQQQQTVQRRMPVKPGTAMRKATMRPKPPTAQDKTAFLKDNIQPGMEVNLPPPPAPGQRRAPPPPGARPPSPAAGRRPPPPAGAARAPPAAAGGSSAAELWGNRGNAAGQARLPPRPASPAAGNLPPRPVSPSLGPRPGSPVPQRPPSPAAGNMASRMPAPPGARPGTPRVGPPGRAGPADVTSAENDRLRRALEEKMRAKQARRGSNGAH